ncbi:hypothetical protein Prudu_000706 [Prunus dulcis]|uniref:Uncharacterized protein n=1 Tax=Prunus dulcis TaxID=3755 RepID=A0A4Y1QLU9_PRUDU|nr:hypothetical protein Prudu_000706 [Prunus dulcis]
MVLINKSRKGWLGPYVGKSVILIAGADDKQARRRSCEASATALADSIDLLAKNIMALLMGHVERGWSPMIYYLAANQVPFIYANPKGKHSHFICDYCPGLSMVALRALPANSLEEKQTSQLEGIVDKVLSFLSEQSKLGTNLMNEDLFQHLSGRLNTCIESLPPFGGGCIAKVEFMHWVTVPNIWFIGEKVLTSCWIQLQEVLGFNMKYREKMVNFVRRLKAKMKRTMMLILKRLPFHFPEHRINDLPEPRLQT